jgi:uncharacterized protein (DUF1015 family)
VAEILPFRGVRFDAARSGPVGPLLAPPYDVSKPGANTPEHSISAIENAELAVPGDQHARAARRYRDWLQQGILTRDPAPAFYLHRHRFDVDGAPTLRTGLFARVRLADWGEGIVLPHERTMSGPREERLARLRAVGANLSPLYFLYRDPCGDVSRLLGEMTSASAGEQDRMGGEHWIEPIVDAEIQRALAACFRGRPLFVADGHHRYEAALAYRNACRRQHPGVDGGWEYVLALLAAVEDPGVVVRPTHRLVTGGNDLLPATVFAVLRRWFDVRPANGSPRVTDVDFLFRAVMPGQEDHDVFTRPGAPHTALLPDARSAAWRDLRVSVLQGVLDSLLGGDANRAKADVVPNIDRDDVVTRVRSGQARAAFLLPTPRLESLLEIAEGGELLPPKSTWFEPKAPAGLVINDLRA